ncbi:ectonucleoside triphosphate diphosphohydrolase 5-like [Asterias amurensis]|uniref:ectonucleoside triphosphate diphosphohydrolase 5-like n=1 Tax=Asterias amurensis TaxID=7602 RepID=UPI003AB78339
MQVKIRPNYKLIFVSFFFLVTALLVFLSFHDASLFSWNSNKDTDKNKLMSFFRQDDQPFDDDVYSSANIGIDNVDDVSNNNILNWLQEDKQLAANKDDFYGVMFDAGSTGSRIHVYHFRNRSEGKPPLLKSEVFNNTKHGLADFADSPKEAVEVVRNLLDIGMKSIPTELWSSTPVALKATAGLRLIPPEKAQRLLDGVYELLLHSGLHTESKKHTVAIIDGIHEGEFIWLTVNFLRGVLGSLDHATNTMGVLDLGGGSTQITFAPRFEETILQGMPLGLIKTFRFMKESFQLYTHSYLGLGLKAARLGTMKLEEQNETSHITSTTIHLNDYSRSNFSTVCLPANMKADWDFAGTSYTASSSNSQEVTNLFNICSKVTKQFMADQVFRPSEIQNRSFYTSSYFLGKGVESGLIDREFGGIIQVKEFGTVAIKACGDFDAANPFLCMDLVYINTLLTHGYGFNADTELVMSEQIRGFDISWALGATIDLLHTHWDNTGHL